MTAADNAAPAVRMYGPGRPLVFTHLPRTAGTALRDALVECLKPEVVHVGFDGYGFGPDDFDSLRPKARALVAASPGELPADAAFVSGHITPATTMARYPGADHLTVLREPRVRVVSLWLVNRAHTDFMLRHWGMMVESLRACRVPLVDYLSNPRVAAHMDNFITRFLVWPHPRVPDAEFIDESADDEVLGAALDRLRRYAFVGLVEDRGFVPKLGEWLGRTLVMPKEKMFRPLPRDLRPDMASEVAAAGELLDTRCRIDMRLWEHVARETLPDQDPTALGQHALDDAVHRYASAVAHGPRTGYFGSALELASYIAGRLRARRAAR